MVAPSAVSHQTTRLATADLEGIGGDHQALKKELRGAIADETISLHFSQSQATVSGSTLGGLTSECSTRTSVTRLVTYLTIFATSSDSPRPGMHFIHDHVF